MKEKINRLARGIVDMELPKLKLSAESCEAVLTSGELNKFEIQLSSENGASLKGLIYSSHPAVRVLKSAFGGLRTKIAVETDAREFREGDEISGSLSVVCNAGERSIPYHFTVKTHPSAELIGRLDTPAELLRLYEEEPRLAVRVFDYDDFLLAGIFRKPGRKVLYEVFRQGQDREHALLEFLRALGEKPRRQKGKAAGEKAEVQKEKPEESAPALTEAELSDRAAVEELAARLIRSGATDTRAFRVYQSAIRHGSRITRLYEFYLYALPAGFEERMPREVYLYFAYENSIEDNVRLPLYYNIIRNFEESSDIYRSFSRRIQQFAIESLLASRINDRLALIYERMIYQDMVDSRIAGVLPGILRACRISVSDPRMQSVHVRYPELCREERYSLQKGMAYVPLFSEDALIFFQDALGNRYASVPYEKKQVMKRPELEEKCREAAPEHPMLRLASARDVCRRGIQTAEELRLLEELREGEELPLSEEFREQLESTMLSYLERESLPEGTISDKELRTLRSMEPAGMERKERRKLLRALIRREEYDRAAELLSAGAAMLPERELLERLLKETLDSPELPQETLLLPGNALFSEGSREPALLEFLLHHYNGLSRDMLEILRASAALLKGEKEKKPEEKEQRRIRKACLSMSERLLAQMLFSSEDQGLDEVYRIYGECGGAEPLLKRAYLSRKSACYFLMEKRTGEACFRELYELVHQENFKDRLPLIYLLALSRFMSEQKQLRAEEKLELQEMMNVLLEKRMIFAYTVRLKKFIPLPDYVTDRSYIEYHGASEEKPQLYVRICPDEAEFHEEEIERVYQNIYVKPLILFAGEKAEYRVCPVGSSKPVFFGTLSADGTVNPYSRGDSYDILNEMSALSEGAGEEELRRTMLHYARNEAVIERLFARSRG